METLALIALGLFGTTIVITLYLLIRESNKRRHQEQAKSGMTTDGSHSAFYAEEPISLGSYITEEGEEGVAKDELLDLSSLGSGNDSTEAQDLSIGGDSGSPDNSSSADSSSSGDWGGSSSSD